MSRAWWHEHAACDGSGDPVFFPGDSPASEERAAEEARLKYCNTCPVYVLCMDSALELGDVGIWAGTTTELRRKLRRKRTRKKCPGCWNDNLRTSDRVCICPSCGLSWTLGDAPDDEPDGIDGARREAANEGAGEIQAVVPHAGSDPAPDAAHAD